MKKFQSISVLAFALSASFTTFATTSKLLWKCKKTQVRQETTYELAKELIGGAVHLTKHSSAGRETLLRYAKCEFSKIEVTCAGYDRSQGSNLTMYTFWMEKDSFFSLIQGEEFEPVVDENLECQFFGPLQKALRQI